MGKNKEEFMKDREQQEEASLNYVYKIFNLEGELEEAKHLLSKSKTMIADMVMYNLDNRPESYNDVMKQAQSNTKVTHTPLGIIKMNNELPLALIDAKILFKMMRENVKR